MISISPFVFNGFSENTYVVFDETLEAAIIDPGCYDKEEKEELDDFINTNHLKVKIILNTHGHIDHVLGNEYVKEKYKAPLLIHPIEEPVLKAVTTYSSVYGFPHYREATPDQYFREGEFITIGHSKWKILFLPGHSPGHVGFYSKDTNALISGDVLFKNSIGRTDLPGGNLPALINSIHQNIFTLPDATVIYPGHGEPTTVGKEKIENPYCALNL